jgi:hypothetical protein
MKTICENCNNEVETVDQEGELPLFGWSFSLNWIGYYAGFSDSWPPNDDADITICHDCCLAMIRVLPALAKRLEGQGWHPGGTDEKPCCEYAWKVEKEDGESVIYRGTPELTWRRAQVWGEA